MGGVAAMLVAFPLFGPVFAGMIALATLCFVAFGRNVMGSSSLPRGSTIDVEAVRRYREQRPETTITEAAAIVARR